jgi:hypothetical protein
LRNASAEFSPPSASQRRNADLTDARMLACVFDAEMSQGENDEVESIVRLGAGGVP